MCHSSGMLIVEKAECMRSRSIWELSVLSLNFAINLKKINSFILSNCLTIFSRTVFLKSLLWFCFLFVFNLHYCCCFKVMAPLILQ